MRATNTVEDMLKQGQFVEAIEEFVSHNGGVSFVELERLLAPYMEVEGDVAFFLPGYETILLWGGISKAFFDAVTTALVEHRIETHPTNVLVYFIDGSVPRMPIAKRLIQYKKDHWLPVAFDKYIEDTPRKKKEKRHA